MHRERCQQSTAVATRYASSHVMTLACWGSYALLTWALCFAALYSCIFLLSRITAAILGFLCHCCGSVAAMRYMYYTSVVQPLICCACQCLAAVLPATYGACCSLFTDVFWRQMLYCKQDHSASTGIPTGVASIHRLTQHAWVAEAARKAYYWWRESLANCFDQLLSALLLQ